MKFHIPELISPFLFRYCITFTAHKFLPSVPSSHQHSDMKSSRHPLPCADVESSTVEKVQADPVCYVGSGYIDREIVILGKAVKVRVAFRAKGVEDWIEQCSPEERHFGFDIEWRPNFTKGEDNGAALVQIAGNQGCLIVQLLHIDHIPTALKDLLANPEMKLGGVGVKGDTAKLLHDYGLECQGEVDLGLLAAEVLSTNNLGRAGLAYLCDFVLGVPFRKIKKMTLSDWATERLSLAQITYAASDACVAHALLVSLNDKLAQRQLLATPRRGFAVARRAYT